MLTFFFFKDRELLLYMLKNLDEFGKWCVKGFHPTVRNMSVTVA